MLIIDTMPAGVGAPLLGATVGNDVGANVGGAVVGGTAKEAEHCGAVRSSKKI